MKKEINFIHKKYLEKTVLFYSALIFLRTAFDEATENNHKDLEKALSDFREYMPESMKAAHSENAPDYETYFYNLQFIELVSNLELFLVEVITLIVSEHPHKIGTQQISLSDIVELNNTSNIIEKACNDYLNDLTYKKPNDYKKKFMNLISAEENLLEDEWPKFIEMKARRDLGVHNDWEANETYERKVQGERGSSLYL